MLQRLPGSPGTLFREFHAPVGKSWETKSYVLRLSLVIAFDNGMALNPGSFWLGGGGGNFSLHRVFNIFCSFICSPHTFPPVLAGLVEEFSCKRNSLIDIYFLKPA